MEILECLPEHKWKVWHQTGNQKDIRRYNCLYLNVFINRQCSAVHCSESVYIIVLYCAVLYCCAV